MTEGSRRAVGKKLRFEIFARDQYQCRYCGRTPPAIILHVDHVLAVAEGGENDPENLVTSCADCNLGKGRTVAPSPPGAPSMADKLSALKEAEEQLAEYRLFLGGARQREDGALQEVAGYWASLFDNRSSLSTKGLSGFRALLKTFTPEKVMEAMDIARARHDDPEDHIAYTKGILRNWKLQAEDPARAVVVTGANKALAFWKAMPGGDTSWLPTDAKRRLMPIVEALGLERVIAEMKTYGRACHFKDLIDGLEGTTSRGSADDKPRGS